MWTASATLVLVVGLVGGLVTARVELAAAAGLGLVCASMAWVIQVRVPKSPVAPALAWCSASVVLVLIVDALSDGALGPRVSALTALFATAIWPLNLAGLLALLLVFPDGRRRGPLDRAVPWLFLGASALLLGGLWGGDEPAGPGLAAAAAVGLALVGVSMVLATVSMALRYRAGGELAREQIRGLMLAGAVVVALLVGGWAAEAAGASITQAYAPFVVGILVLVPLAVGVAIVRHDLFDIDRIVSEGVASAATVVVAAGAYGVAVGVVGSMADRYTAIGPAVGGFVAALVLLPTYRVLRDATARVLDRDRFLAVRRVEQFTAAVRSGQAQPEQVEDVLRGAQDDEDLRLLLVDGSQWVGLDGRPAPECEGIDVSSGGDVVARLVLGRDSLRARRLAAALARAAWIPIEVSRLRLGLRRSQARIAEATAQERKRWERDLHDSAQQRILATGMRLRCLQPGLDADRSAEIDLAVTELQDTIAELRRLAQGVRPSRLDDGLDAALEDLQQTTPLPMDLQVCDLPEVDESRTLAAYLVVTEALANTLKHGQASRIAVRVGRDANRLVVEVCDDGVGGIATADALTSLQDRVLSVGGNLTVSSPAGMGTEIRAVL